MSGFCLPQILRQFPPTKCSIKRPGPNGYFTLTQFHNCHKNCLDKNVLANLMTVSLVSSPGTLG